MLCHYNAGDSVVVTQQILCHCNAGDSVVVTQQILCHCNAGDSVVVTQQIPYMRQLAAILQCAMRSCD